MHYQSLEQIANYIAHHICYTLTFSLYCLLEEFAEWMSVEMWPMNMA